jgi:hypothetical protein
MGSTTVAKSGSATNVNRELSELAKLSKDPVANLDAMNRILERLSVARMTSQQKAKLAAAEQSASAQLTPEQRMSLYLFSLPRGRAFVKVSEITELQEAIGTLNTFSKTPLLYLLEIEDLYTRFGAPLQSSKAAKEINRKLTASELEFATSGASAAQRPRAVEKEEAPVTQARAVKLVPSAEQLEDVEVSHAQATGAVESEISSTGARAKTRRTRITLLPEEQRFVGAPVKAPSTPVSLAIPKSLGPDNATTMSDNSKDMFKGYFSPSRDSNAGTTFVTAWMNGVNTATGQSGPLDVTNASDPRWRFLRSNFINVDVSTQEGRQEIVNIMNELRKGNYIEAMNMMPGGSPLKSNMAKYINQICPQMLTGVPLSAITTGLDLELWRFLGGKLTLGPHAWLSHITSQQYQPELKSTIDSSGNEIYSLSIKPAGYTAKQLITRVGATGKYHPWDYATLQLDIAAETPYGVVESGDTAGQSQLLALSKTQGLIQLSFTDASGRTAGWLKLPLYYALRGTYRAPSNSLSLTGAAGVGLGRLKGMPIMIVADIGAEIQKGSSEYAQPIADLIGRLGVGITPSSASGTVFPMKFYALKSGGGEPSPLGLKVESTIGGGADIDLYGIRLGAEMRYRTMMTISGMPVTGAGNVMMIFNIDPSEFVHKSIFKTER